MDSIGFFGFLLYIARGVVSYNLKICQDHLIFREKNLRPIKIKQLTQGHQTCIAETANVEQCVLNAKTGARSTVFLRFCPYEEWTPKVSP